MATPHCPHCQAKAPDCLGLQNLNQLGLLFCNQCGAILGLVALPAAPKAKKTEAAPIGAAPPPGPALAGEDGVPKKKKIPTGPLEFLGNTDLSGKLPYNPEAIANRMRAAGILGGSQYLRVAVDNGPPLCLMHKLEMIKVAIPSGYKNAGREVWLCPAFKTCKQWELAQ